MANKKSTNKTSTTKKTKPEKKNEEVTSKRKKIVEEEVDIEDVEDFEEYDDEDELVEETPKVKEKKSEVIKTRKPHDDLEIIKMLAFITLCVSVVSVIISIVTLVVVTGNKNDSPEETTETDDGYDTSMFEEITTKEFLDILNKNDDKLYIVNVGRSGCPYSQRFLPNLQQSIKDYDYTLYYMSTENSDYGTYASEIVAKDDAFTAEETAFGSTPQTYAVKNGKVIDTNAGATEYDEYASFLENLGIQKK